MFLVNSRFPLVCATPSSSGREVRHPDGVILLPKLRMYFAEFLNHSSPDRLGILYLPTCVGLGYGHHVSSLEAFLGSMGSVTSPEAVRHHISGYVTDGFAYRSPYLLAPGQPSPGRPTLLRPPIAIHRGIGTDSARRPASDRSLSDWARTWWYRNINLLCIDYAFRPRLSSRLTLGG